MARRRALFRLLAIQRVLVKYGLDDIIKETHLLRPLRFLFYLAPRRRDRSAPVGERIRLALEELGPIFVKFGQAISTRRDLLPPDIADELAKLPMEDFTPEEEKKLEEAEQYFKDEVQKLQETYQKLSTDKDEKIAAVKAAGLVDALSGEGPLTVFAPTDAAFVAALEALGVTAEDLLADSIEATE